MGAFYVNITTKGTSVEKIIEYLDEKDLAAYVISSDKGYCTIYEEKCDEQQTKHISNLLKNLSDKFNCSALGILNHDDDILAYELWEKGEKVDEYDSCPGYFTDDESRMNPEGGNPELLSNLMGAGSDIGMIEKVLKTSGFEDDKYMMATDRHQALVDAAGLPSCSVGFGFNTLSQDIFPPETDPENIHSINV